MKKYRTFLNKDGFAAVEVEEARNWITLSISDCSRHVTLEFGVDKENTKAQRLAKLKKLEKALEHVKELINVAQS